MDIEATVRFETPPGRQGQVDWGQCWTIIAGKRMKVHLLVLTLRYSRKMYAVTTTDEKMPAFLRSHEEAFEFLGGVPHEIVYDNLKLVVLGRDFEGSWFEGNLVFWDFSRYYSFRPNPHRPQTKGKVESGVKYVKRFLRGKEFLSLDDLNSQLLAWIVSVADQRIHGRTHRRPAEMFLEEKDLLHSSRGRPAYVLEERAVRYVSKDCLVAFETNRYSVPVGGSKKGTDSGQGGVGGGREFCDAGRDVGFYLFFGQPDTMAFIVQAREAQVAQEMSVLWAVLSA